MRPGEVLDGQGDLIIRAQGTEYRSLLTSVVSDAGLHDERVAIANEMASKLVGILGVSYAYQVSSDMSRLVQFAATQLDDSDIFERDQGPTPAGIVYFEEPIPLINHRGRETLMHWLVWGPGVIQGLVAPEEERHSTMVLFTFNDVWKRPDESYQAAYEHLDNHQREFMDHAMGRWSMNACEVVASGGPLGPPEVAPDHAAVRWLTEVGVQAEGTFPRTNPVRYLHALWLMLNQTITHVERERPERASWRRAKRMQLPQEVTVIRLRREEVGDREPGESQVEWQHRWIVRGHWRWQACGVGRQERRRIWIHPFVKGPEGAPLKQSEKVYRLDR